MDTKELKFLLKLLGQPNYRAKITELNPTSGTKAANASKEGRFNWWQTKSDKVPSHGYDSSTITIFQVRWRYIKVSLGLRPTKLLLGRETLLSQD